MKTFDKMSGLYELEGIPKAYSIQAAEVQKSREAKIQHLLQHVSPILNFLSFLSFQLDSLTRFLGFNLEKSHVTVDLHFLRIPCNLRKPFLFCKRFVHRFQTLKFKLFRKSMFGSNM